MASAELGSSGAKVLGMCCILSTLHTACCRCCSLFVNCDVLVQYAMHSNASFWSTRDIFADVIGIPTNVMCMEQVEEVATTGILCCGAVLQTWSSVKHVRAVFIVFGAYVVDADRVSNALNCQGSALERRI